MTDEPVTTRDNRLKGLKPALDSADDNRPIGVFYVRSVAVFLIVFCGLLGLFLIYLPTYKKSILDNDRHQLRDEVTPYAQSLKASSTERLGITRGLTAFVKSSPSQEDLAARFPVFAAVVFANDKSLVTAGVSPGGVIAYIYPYMQKSIGLDLKNDPRPDVRRDVAATIAKKTAIMGGPVLHSASGKIVMVIREPIFNQDGSFWGLTNVAFDKEQMFKDSGIDHVSRDVVFGVKELGGDFLYGNKTVFKNKPVTVKVDVPGATWIIGVVPKSGWEAYADKTLWPVVFGSLVFIFIMATLITVLINRQWILQTTVSHRTKELKSANKMLQEQIDKKEVAQRAIIRLNRLYAVLSKVNETIVREEDRDKLLNEVCRIIVEEGGFRMGWIGVIDQTTKRVVPAATAGVVEGYFDKIKMIVPSRPEGHGPKARALMEQRSFVCNDIEKDREMAPWLETSREHGYRSEATFPLVIDNSLIGSLNIYSSEVGVFRGDEVKLLDEIAGDTAYAIHAIDRAAQKRESENVLGTMVAASPLAIVTVDNNRNVKMWNKSAEILFGWTAEEALGKPLPYIPDSGKRQFEESQEQDLAGTGGRRGSIAMRVRKDGSMFDAEIWTEPLRDASGKITGVVGMIADVSRRQETEKRIAYEASFPRGNPSPVIEFGKDEKVIFNNPAAMNVLAELDAGEKLGVYLPKDFNVIANMLDKKKDDLTVYREVKIKNKVFGENIYLAKEFNTIRIYAFDVTENKEAEEKLRRQQIELARSYEVIKHSLDGTVQAIAALAEHKDPYTAGHERKVVKLALAIGREMKLEESLLEGLRIAATLHDVGKMYVPAEILSKPGKLNELEFDMIKIHPQYSYDVLSKIEFPWPVAEIALQHHERIDGSGYPNGLKGEEIMLEAEILAVADVIEAMASHRPYRPALSLSEALDEIKENSGRLYDPKVVKVTLKIFKEGYTL